MENNATITDRQIPGGLQTQVSIEMHSKEATNLFYGQEGNKDEGLPWIVGVVQFAERLKQMNFAAHNNDPYADYFLLKVEKALEFAKQRIKKDMEIVLATKDDSLLNINVGSSRKPVVVETSYNNVYSNIALTLLKQADDLIMGYITLKSIGLLTTEEANDKISGVKKLIRKTFLSSGGYRYTQITRQDVIDKTDKYKTAHALMKMTEDLSQDLLDKKPTARAKHAPNIIIDFNSQEFKREGKVRRPNRSATNTKV